MTDTASGLLTIAALVALLAIAYVPLGNYMARVFTATGHTRVERRLYRLLGVAPDVGQSAKAYGTGVLAFSLVSLVSLFTLLMVQHWLPMNRDVPPMRWDMAVNTAVSFVTNTNWQSYSGETTLGFTAQAAGLAVQNFASAAVGLCVAVALIRAFARSSASDLGNFWADLVRATFRILLPLAAIAAVFFISQGVIQNFGDQAVRTVTGQAATVPGGPVASQEAIKLLGTNGGGFFNANSAHPFENPTPLSNLVQLFLILVIPVSLTRTFGQMTGRRRQSLAILAAMTVPLTATASVAIWAEAGGHSRAASAAGGAMEGKETQFGAWGSALYSVVTTGTSTGAVNSAHDSMTPAGGAMALVNMLLGEVSPGGVGAGLYGILIMAMVAVFVAGLMVGRTPEFMGKHIGTREMTYVALYALTAPALVLAGVGLTTALPGTSDALGNDGNHGLTSLVYAFASAANNNGSAFGSVTATSTHLQVALAVAMLVGRFVPIVLVLLLARSLAAQRTRPATPGTVATDTPLFTALLVGVIVLVTGLTYFPLLALGPLAEALA